MFGTEFYPTPKTLLMEIKQELPIDFREIRTMLEPSAGRGDILDFIKDFQYNIYMDCIEQNKDLRSVLKGKKYTVIHDDFLTFHTFKRYDLIFMNPPFSQGARHLLKALELVQNGGKVICILNRETIDNPCTNERKVLVNQLQELDATVLYKTHAFSDADRRTDVEIAIAYVDIPIIEKESFFFSSMKEKHYARIKEEQMTDIVTQDYIQNAVIQYEIEVESGIRLIEEYYRLSKHTLSNISTSEEENKYNKSILNLSVYSIEAHYTDINKLINFYVESTSSKYWKALFENPKFTNGMTSDQIDKYRDIVSGLSKFDFSVRNILELQIDMTQNLIRGIEECIINLFDELSRKHSYNDEYSKNIHYYNGWKTNKSWIINKKVIIPLSCYCNIFNCFDLDKYEVIRKLSDIEKVLNYLDGGLTDGVSICNVLQYADAHNITRNIHCKYFDVTFYKKGTCHIVFNNEDLLKKFNIFGSQHKGWLPPSYGKKKFKEMSLEEQQVIREFEGEESYSRVISNVDYYLLNIGQLLPQLEQLD